MPEKTDKCHIFNPLKGKNEASSEGDDRVDHPNAKDVYYYLPYAKRLRMQKGFSYPLKEVTNHIKSESTPRSKLLELTFSLAPTPLQWWLSIRPTLTLEITSLMHVISSLPAG